MITGITAWFLVIGTLSMAIFMVFFIIWAFISDRQWQKKKAEEEREN